MTITENFVEWTVEPWIERDLVTFIGARARDYEGYRWTARVAGDRLPPGATRLNASGVARERADAEAQARRVAERILADLRTLADPENFAYGTVRECP